MRGGLYQLYKEQRKLMTMREVTRGFLIKRMADQVSISALNGMPVIRTHSELDKALRRRSDHDLFHTPEGIVIAILHDYWAMKKQTDQTDLEILEEIHRGRMAAGHPMGTPPGDLDLSGFIISRVRIEEHDQWDEYSISDAEIDQIIAEANHFYESYF